MSQSNPAAPENCDCRRQDAPVESALPLSYARTLSWLSLVVILLTSLGLSFFISNSARETLLTRQEDFARLLVENLNSQIFRRFALPTILANGRIALRQPAQYERLDQVVQSVIHGLPVERLRIYDFSRLVAYSTKKEDLGRAGLSPPNLDDVLHGAAPKSEIISSIPAWQAPFRVPLREGTFVLRVLYPLRGETLRPGEQAPVMGALELTQEELAARLGKSRPAIANALRLLQLSQAARDDLRAGNISAGHARCLLGVTDAEAAEALRRRIISHALTVRDAEEAASFWRENHLLPWQAENASPGEARTEKEPRARTGRKKSAQIRSLQENLSQTLACKALVSGNEQNGKITLSYASAEELQNLLARLGVDLPNA